MVGLSEASQLCAFVFDACTMRKVEVGQGRGGLHFWGKGLSGFRLLSQKSFFLSKEGD